MSAPSCHLGQYSSKGGGDVLYGIGGCSDFACFFFVFGFVVHVFPCQSTGGEFVLFCQCFAVYDGAFEAGIGFDLLPYSSFPM